VIAINFLAYNLLYWIYALDINSQNGCLNELFIAMSSFIFIAAAAYGCSGSIGIIMSMR
jgi:hypothetical protein